MSIQLSVLLDKYLDLLAEVDRWFSRCSLIAGGQILCNRGCSSCCCGLFDITLLDAAVIQSGFRRLPEGVQQTVLQRSTERLHAMRQIRPDFSSPWFMNRYPEDEWGDLMPDEDETPCPYLSGEGTCLIYQYRPMTCRLHGIQLVDTGGEILFEEYCSLNFKDTSLLQDERLRAPFNDIFMQEQLLFRQFTRILYGKPFNEIDTVIPAAAMIRFDQLPPLPEQ